MAIVKNNILLQFVKGTLGDMLTVYERNGVIIIAAKRGPSKNKPTQAQLQARLKMKLAVKYAKRAMEDPELKAAYQATAGIGQNAFNMAVKDAYNSPMIINIHVEEEQTIVVRTQEDFRVAAVKITVYDKENKMVEKGDAYLTWNRMDWKYRCEHLPPGSRVEVKAFDLPGNSAMKEIMLT
jgi:hypothetical protein